MGAVATTVRRCTRPGRVGLIGVLLLAILAVGPSPLAVHAALNVTDCTDSGDAGSLRYAIAHATAGDTITFAQDCTSGSAITLATTIVPPVSVTIDATASSPQHAVTITTTGGNGVQLFSVNNSGVTLGLTGLTLTGGNSAASGGAIANTGGTVNIVGCTLSGNSALSGGAIANSGGTVNIIGSTLSGNSGVNGGAIVNDAGATLNSTGNTFSGNTATGNSSGGGGAIYNGGTVFIATSTFSGNTAAADGGAIYFDSSAAMNLVMSSTFSGNAASGNVYGGGAIHLHSNGSLALKLSLVAGNTAPNVSTASSDIANYSGGMINSNGGNVIGINDGSTGFTPAGNDRTGTVAAPLAPLLAPLGNYGGTVQTVALLPGSPAINIASCPAGLTVDARGVNRPQDTNCDAGSYESHAFTPGAPTDNGQHATVGATFASPVGVPVMGTMGDPVTGGQVTFTITPGTNGAAATFNSSPTCTVTAVNTVAVCMIAMSGSATTPTITANTVAGSFTIVATALGIASPVTFTETNLPGPAAAFTVSGFPSPVTAGTSGSVTVTAKDASGNVATGYIGTVTITSSDAMAVLPPNAMLTNGVGAFSVTLNTAGTQRITATDTTMNTITGVQTGIIVNPALTLGPAMIRGSGPGAPYNQPLMATGGTGSDTYALATGSALPKGLTLNSSTGMLSGTAPTNPGSYHFTVQVTDSTHATASRAYTLVVATPNATPVPKATTATTGVPAMAPPTHAAAPTVSGSTPLPQPVRH